jgi:hypothetical protein
MHAVSGRSCWEGLGTEFFRKDAITLLASDVQYGLWYQSVCVYAQPQLPRTHAAASDDHGSVHMDTDTEQGHCPCAHTRNVSKCEIAKTRMDVFNCKISNWEKMGTSGPAVAS